MLSGVGVYGEFEEDGVIGGGKGMSVWYIARREVLGLAREERKVETGGKG